jgi:hypothetical protein
MEHRTLNIEMRAAWGRRRVLTLDIEMRDVGGEMWLEVEL